MANSSKNIVKELLGMRSEMSFGFYITDFIFRKLFRQNADTSWAIHHSTTIHSPNKIIRGKNVYPGDSPGVYINAANGITIGDYTNIGPNVGLISSNHDFINNNIHITTTPINIGKFCWIGMGAVILPSISLGDFTIVGAGSIVTKSFKEGHCIIAGNPAKIIKNLNRDECNAFANSK